MTKVALVGYGAMGKELERLAPQNNVEIVSVHDLDKPLTTDAAKVVDAVIDFTQPDSVMQTVATCCAAGTPLVIGTTGWQDQLETVREMAEKHGIGIVYASNFSLGVNLFMGLVERAGTLFNAHSEFDATIHEWHHKRKKDSPSGTALSVAQTLLEQLIAKTHIETETQHAPIDPAALHVTSTRGGETIGIHRVTFDGPHDTITLEHHAKDRAGFAAGALIASTQIHNVKGLTSFYDLISGVSNK